MVNENESKSTVEHRALDFFFLAINSTDWTQDHLHLSLLIVVCNIDFCDRRKFQV